MNPIIKKSLIAVAAKKGFDKVNEKRSSGPSKKSRLGKFLLLGGVLGALAFAYNSGKLQPLIEKVRGGGGSNASSNGSSGSRDVTLGEKPLSTPVA